MPPAPDPAALLRVGAPLWAATAQKLAGVELPEHWNGREWQGRTGLTVSVLKPLLAALCLALTHAAAMRALPPAGEAEFESRLNAILNAAIRGGPLGWGIMLGILMSGCGADAVIPHAIRLSREHRFAPQMSTGLDQAARETLERLEGRLGMAPPEGPLDAELAAERIAMIEKIDGFTRLEHRPPEEQRQVARLKQKLVETSHALFERSLRARLLPALGTATLPPAGPDDDGTTEALQSLEAEARQLRRLAIAARRLGDGTRYDRLLQEAAQRYRPDNGPDAAGLSRIERMRLVEVLAGTDVAARLAPS
jgi:hypothetical protein